MGNRRQARELALQALFFFDMAGTETDPDIMLEKFCINFSDQIPDHVKPFFLELVKGVLANKSRIDELLAACSKNWRLSRMPAVDRNIMRVATLELLFFPDIPASVSINEAVEIGKKFGSRDSGAFINGVLDRLSCMENVNLEP